MNKKDKIVEILESWETDNGHYFNSISKSDYRNIANEIVKLFAIPVVSGSFTQEDLQDLDKGGRKLYDKMVSEY